MKWIKLFEDFKENNTEGTLITEDDIIKCIENRGVIFMKTDPKKALSPKNIEGDDITVDGEDGEELVDLQAVKRIEY